jgi:outer membrane immunogenic protein
MKRLAFAVVLSACAGSAALAADMAPPPPVPKAPYVPPPFNWSGFYIGGNLGAGWNNISIADTAGNSFSGTSSTQFVGGGQVGANYQFWGGAVIGVEADFDWLPNTNNTNTATGVGGNTISVAINNRWLTTVTGRLGYAWDRVLVYAKGGGAWVGASNPSIVVNGASFAPSTSSTNFGWTAGFGAEWAFWGNWSGTWSVRAEYDFVGLNNQTFVVPAAAPVLAGDVISTHNRDFQMVTVGFNYRFGAW